MLRQRRRRQEGAVDAGGGHRPRLLYPAARPRELALRAREHRLVDHCLIDLRQQLAHQMLLAWSIGSDYRYV